MTQIKGYFIGALVVAGVSALFLLRKLQSLEQENKDLKGKVSRNRESSVTRKMHGQVDAVVGTQWGDEGKGKLVDIISSQYDICARVAGGSNAGHTIVANGRKYKFHLIPSAILHSNVICVIGNGVVVHLRGLLQELATLRDAGVDYANRILISDRAHIVFDFHQLVDGYNEKNLGGNKIGTTLKGIGPAYSSKTMRNGLRVGDLLDMEYFETRLRGLAQQLERSFPGISINVEEELKYYQSIKPQILPMVTDTVFYCNNALKEGKRILVEGANATMIDLDFGTYPYVTSSNPSSGSCCTGLGVPPQVVKGVTGIVKAYCTRVGEGPFPTELTGEVGEKLRSNGGEFGTTTGRPRRCGWLDIPQLRYSLELNGVTEINLTKLDVLTGFETIQIGVKYVRNGSEVKRMPASLKIYSEVKMEYETLPGWTEDISKCRSFENLPINCQRYVSRIEELLDYPIRWIGVGPARHDIIDRRM